MKQLMPEVCIVLSDITNQVQNVFEYVGDDEYERIVSERRSRPQFVVNDGICYMNLLRG